MLEPDQVDLTSLAEALEDHGGSTSWWLDPTTGACDPWVADDDLDDGDPFERGWHRVWPIGSRESYLDMAEFAEAVSDPRMSRRLQRAIEGRGAFRRFKDELWDDEQLRQAWFVFHDARMRRRAVRWLVDEGLVDEAAARHDESRHPLPVQPELTGPFDPDAVVRDVADDLRRVYGDRLGSVRLFGSWARGDADDDSDVDVLVALEGAVDPIAERRRVADLAWEMTRRSGKVVSVVFTSTDDVAAAATPFLARVAAESRVVA